MVVLGDDWVRMAEGLLITSTLSFAEGDDDDGRPAVSILADDDVELT
jgi:hypothetical protein